MKKLAFAATVILVPGLAFAFAVELPAQTGSSRPPSAEQSDSKPIPRAALLTERGRQLAKELRLLRRSRETMGSKHPSLPLINQKIADIEEQLQAWEPAFGEPAANPFHPEREAPQMNEYDLRQMVIRLSKRVEQLEKRVAELESRS